MTPSEQTFPINDTLPMVPFMGHGHCTECQYRDEIYTPDGLARLGIRQNCTLLDCPVCAKRAFIIE